MYSVWLSGLHKLRYTSFALPFLKLALEGTLLHKMPQLCFCRRLICLSPVPLWYISDCAHGAGRTATLAWRSKFHRLLVNLHVAVCKVKGPSPSSTRILNGLVVLLMHHGSFAARWRWCHVYLFETNRAVFQHFIRQCIRHRLTKDLDAKHERWKGIEKIDIKQTTALYRIMLPRQNGRVALARRLSNAHATPHRLYKTNAHCTPACRYCSCPDADVIHIAFQCPRFHFIRADWPAVLEGWEQWPPCAKHCLVATTELPQHVLSRECKTLRAPYFSVKTQFSMSFYYKNLQSSWFA